jgi:hypothetical protein
LLFVVILTLFYSCSKGRSDEQVPITSGEDLTGQLPISPDQNSDGDLESDLVELENGRNPLVADLPSLKFSFSQNFILKFERIESEETHLINTDINSDDSDFKYSVGSLLIRSNSYDSIARFAKFSNHHYGQIDDFELNWYKYPTLDQQFFHDELLRLKNTAFKDALENQRYSIIFKNSLTLKRNTQFQEITNLKLRFHYYDYESNSYEQIGTKIIEKRFLAGVKNEFEIELDNLPSNLIYDNFLKKGELIVAEIVDYEIPSYSKNYSTLIAQVKHFSIPVALNTPLGSEIKYVGINGKRMIFSEILQILYPNDYVIESGNIVRVEQFKTSLTSFTNLKELRANTKDGKWFVMTNKLDRGYQDYFFSSNDKIILSYILGSELAARSSNIAYQFSEKATGHVSGNRYELGELSTNSRIDIQLRPSKVFGNTYTNHAESFSSAGGSCGRNCMTPPHSCNYQINVIKNYSFPFRFKGPTKELENLGLEINNKEFKLSELLEDEKIKTYYKNKNLHILIEDIDQIFAIEPNTENKLFLKIHSPQESVFNGVKITHTTGDWIRTCIPATLGIADKLGTTILSNSSIPHALDRLKFDRNNFWTPQARSKFSFQDDVLIFKNIEIDISSTINNYFN